MDAWKAPATDSALAAARPGVTGAPSCPVFDIAPPHISSASGGGSWEEDPTHTARHVIQCTLNPRFLV